MAIVACSTPPGVSGIAVVRISGEDAIKNVSTFVKDSPLNKTRPVSKVCFLVDKDGEVFDEAIVTSYISPNSYTGENLVEISCHGNPKIISKIIDLSAADTLFSFGGIPVNILPFLMAGSMYYTMKLSSAAQPAGGDPAQEATQQMMKYMFPGMMFFLFYSFPSGLNLYYLCFNVMQIAQQKIINNEKTETVRK